MSNVIHLASSKERDGNPVHDFDRALFDAIAAAKDAGVTSGYIVALLHARLTIETQVMISE